MTAQATKNDQTDQEREQILLCKDRKGLQILYAVAMIMVGSAKKNEYSVATRRSIPTRRPPMMVAPEREMPGKTRSIARARPQRRFSHRPVPGS